MGKTIAAYIALVLVISVLVGLGTWAGGSTGFARYLKGMTISEDVIPRGGSFDVVYVLGGAQPSMRMKYERLGSLCRKIAYTNIMILDRPGITGYNAEEGRNLTNNEWSLMRLEREGIKRQDIELVSIDEGYFGTFSEARAVTGLMKERGYRTVLLITAPHHTARVKKSFNRMLEGEPGMTSYVTGSEEVAAVGELLMENLKLMIYTFILLPIQS